MAGLRRLWGCYSACAVVLMSLQLFALILVASIALGTGFFRLPILSEIIAPERRDAAATHVPAEASLLEQKWQAAVMGGPGIRVEVSQSEVNRIIAEIVASEPVPLQQMRAELRESQVRISGRLPGPLPITAQVWGRVEARNGVMQFVAEGVYAGDLPLPRLLAEPFVSWANQQFRRPLVDEKIPLSVDKVEVRPGLAVIYGAVPDGWRPAGP